MGNDLATDLAVRPVSRGGEFGAVSQEGITATTKMGANLVPGGATFRVWAPEALEMHIRLSRTGDVINAPDDAFQPEEATRLQRDAAGRWSGFVSDVKEGDHYRFYMVGAQQPYIRDPYARELEFHDWPDVDCIVRDPGSYRWHDAGYATPRFPDVVIYQLHFGTWHALDGAGRDDRKNRVATFLDAVERIPYLADLGVTAVQPLPVTEYNSVPDAFDPTPRSLGYNGTDLFSPEMDYGVEPESLPRYLDTVNRMLAERGQSPLSLHDLTPQINQLKAFIDLCHLYGIAVFFDVVYNHAGGFDKDDQSLYYFLDGNGERLYFKRDGWAGGLVFDFDKPGVRQLLIDNAKACLDEYRVDGFRYDEVSVIDHFGGWHFCQDLTGTVKYHRSSSLHIAEFWSNDPSWAIRPSSENGAGFDSVVHAGLRGAVRGAVAATSAGRNAGVNLDPVRDALRRPHGFTAAWQMVHHLENHDRQRVQNDNDREPRIVALADPSNPRSWYARSRARVANGLLLTAPGIPMVFMGQEFLEDKFWTDDPDNHPGNLIWWDGLEEDRAMRDHHVFTRDLLHLRRRHPALRGESTNAYYVFNNNRIMAYHRWIEGVGRDIVVVASLHELTFDRYKLGFPQAGRWLEVFNSDYYDHYPNSWVAGNGGAIEASFSPRDGLPASAEISIPANSLLVFARDGGD